MKSVFQLAFIFFTAILVSTPTTNIKAQSKSNSPIFIDNGKTIDSIKKVFNCETIECENSADKKIVDSCLTVYLINSRNVIPENDFNIKSQYLKNVAVSIMHVLLKPQDYKTIYVFSVNKFRENGKEKTMHTAGLELFTKGLFMASFLE